MVGEMKPDRPSLPGVRRRPPCAAPFEIPNLAVQSLELIITRARNTGF